MTHLLRIERDTVAGFMRSLADGLPIDAPEGGWTGRDMLMLASAAFAGVISQGPQDWSTLGDAAPRLRSMHPEHAEARFERFSSEVHAAIDLGSEWCLSIHDGDDVPEEVAFVVKQAPDGAFRFKEFGDAVEDLK